MHMTQEERDNFICIQSIKIAAAGGYDVPEDIAMDFFYDMDTDDRYRLDILEAVFNCLAFATANEVNDKVIEAFISVIEECEGVNNAGLMADMVYQIAKEKGPQEGL